MRTVLITGGALLFVAISMATGMASAAKGEKIDGKKEFERHCAVCHPNGGNIINAKKLLNRRSLEGNGIMTAKDIVATMRNPGPGMTKFDDKTISNKEAKAIADYILKTFK